MEPRTLATAMCSCWRCVRRRTEARGRSRPPSGAWQDTRWARTKRWLPADDRAENGGNEDAKSSDDASNRKAYRVPATGDDRPECKRPERESQVERGTV